MTSLIVGLSGATCSGKTTLANLLHKLFLNSSHLNQDLYYWEDDSENHRKVSVLQKGGQVEEAINWELISAFDMEKLADHIRRWKNKTLPSNTKTWMKRSYTSSDIFVADSDLEFRKDFLDEIAPIRGAPMVFVEGILLFNEPNVAGLCDLKYFHTLDYETCLARRKTRTYDPPDMEGYFEQVVWPWYKENRTSMEKSNVKNIALLDGRNSLGHNFSLILNDLIKKLLY